jgi:hypothetical protein
MKRLFLSVLMAVPVFTGSAFANDDHDGPPETNKRIRESAAVLSEIMGAGDKPATVRIEGGSVGFQIGAGETDVIFIVMNRRGMANLDKDKFTMGGDASAMAGPVGRSAEARTDAMMKAEILSYSRSPWLRAIARPTWHGP